MFKIAPVIFKASTMAYKKLAGNIRFLLLLCRLSAAKVAQAAQLKVAH